MKRLKPYLRPYRKEFILGPAAKLIEAVIELILPLLMAHIIDFGVSANNPAVIRSGSILMGSLIVVGLFFSLSCQYMASLASQGVGTGVRNALFQHVMELRATQIEKFGTGSLTNRLTVDVTQLQVGVAMTIRLLVRAPFLCIGGFIMAAGINWKLSLILLAIIPLALLLLYFVMRATVRLFGLVQQKLDKLAELVQDNIAGSRVIRAFHRQDGERRIFHAKNTDWEQMLLRAGRYAAVVNPFTMLLFNSGIVAVLYFGGIEIQMGNLSQGELIALLNYLNQIVAAMIVVANLVITLTRGWASARRVATVLGEPIVTPEDERKAESVLFKPQESMPNHAILAVQQLGYTYPDANEPALQEIHFTIGKGETLGIIGGTGSGKSTLAKLLAGVYQPGTGSLQFSEEIECAQRSVAIIFQKTKLFSGTIAQNLRLGAPEATDEELWAALEIAQAAKFVADKEGGLNYQVERDGLNFSGGQRQRLALARGLVKRPAVLILDDSSSALDYLTDAAFSAALTAWAGTETALVIISQRIYQVAHLNQILVLNNGRQVGLGTHRELQAENPLYQEICASQLVGPEGSAS